MRNIRILSFILLYSLLLISCQENERVVVKHYDYIISYNGKGLEIVTNMRLLNEGEKTKEIALFLPEGADVKSVSIDNKKLRIKRKGDKVYIYLHSNLENGKEIEIELCYNTEYDFRRKGVFEGFPSGSNLSSITSTLDITVPESHFVVAGGELEKITYQDGHKRYLYINSIPAFLTGFFIGEGLEHYSFKEDNREFELFIVPEERYRSNELLETIKEAYYFGRIW